MPNHPQREKGEARVSSQVVGSRSLEAVSVLEDMCHGGALWRCREGRKGMRDRRAYSESDAVGTHIYKMVCCIGIQMSLVNK